jgi:peptidylprolyl isomerase
MARLLPIAVFAAATAVLAAGLSAAASEPVTPASVLAGTAASDWAPIDPNDLLLIDLADGGRVAIALAPAFAPVHVANIRALARASWFDGLAIDRVQDGYVIQWGDIDDKKPLPTAGIVTPTPAEYERPAAGLAFTALPYSDTFAPRTGYVGPFAVGQEGRQAWMAHCYGIVGAGRNNNPDAGTGAELYAVIGHSPRQLDRNIALVGRVVEGMERLTALPRGTADMGFYATAKERMGIVRERIAIDLPAAERPAYEYLRPGSAGFAAWLKAKANRKDDFYLRPAGATDLCGGLPPVRPVRRG